ncbi:DcrB-related protein [Chitinophaga silvisoli]|uniref:DUF1795 domain-containing protein n=1 Tax=Chitinophaga silvisoli TaxID=2291814 RepID=A0A3E1NTE1_9BACT|nr:DcrB-related protein [Chitinophaga silvisoli]RFM31114.1 DUF1795 domain-containing protein [Chitinophaga silvisoli]
MKKIVGLLVLTLALACNTKQQPKTAEEVLSTINKTNLNKGSQNYHLDTPEGWTTDHKTIQGINYYYIIAPNTGEVPSPNINLLTESMQGASLKDYIAKSLSSLKQVLPTSEVKASGDITANGIQGAWYNYTMEMQGVKAYLMAYVFPKDGIAYVITGICPPDKATKYRPVFDSVAKSFKMD